MNRSHINLIIDETQAFFAQYHFCLPPFAGFTLEQWKTQAAEPWQEVFDLQLGWDVTSFGGNDFSQLGLTLFTLRNGSPNGKPYRKCYAEKIMHCREQQVTPMHFHWYKTEDIINRGGGNLIIEIHNADPYEALDSKPVTVVLDGCRQTHAAGSHLRLHPGESITLTPGLYHSFWGEAGKGDVLVGEVSMVNDDNGDNRFLTPMPRFDQILEDQAVKWVLCHEYARLLTSL
ncbi:MAG: D-lyxose/D-mannose family sugar isomerase [Enterobacteriaceae bacterium]